MNDAPLMEAYAELRALLHNPGVPERVTLACLSLSQHQTKLFCTVPDHDFSLRLEPSKFLRELISILRSAEWPRVLVHIQDKTSSCATS